MTLEEQLLQIERQLWTNNAELYREHLVEDAMLERDEEKWNRFSARHPALNY